MESRPQHRQTNRGANFGRAGGCGSSYLIMWIFEMFSGGVAVLVQCVQAFVEFKKILIIF